MKSTSILSLLFLLLLPCPSLLYSLKNCTVDFYDQNIIICDFHELTTIPTDIPKSATELSLFVNYIKRIKQTDFTGFTKLENLHLGHNVISYIDDGAFSDLSALTTLILSFNNLTNLTANMFKGLSTLLHLYLACNKIETISKSAFEPLNTLQELDLGSNKLSQISDFVNIILHSPALKILLLGDNQLTSFESEYLPFPLMNLTKLVLSSNTLRRFCVHSDVFPHLESLSLSQIGPEFEWNVSDKHFLKSLKFLDLSMTTLKMETCQLIFQSVDFVEKLFFQSNGKLIYQGLLDLACIPSLEKLFLTDNNIYFLNKTLLQLCTNLTELDLTSNSMTDLSESSLRMLTRLNRLNFENNLLSCVPLAIRNMSTLTFLSFQSNHITDLQCSDFSNLLSLTELNLNSNRIYKVNSCVFRDLQNLKVINVQNNFLSQITDSFNVGLFNLVTLDGNGNNLGWLQKDTFHNMHSLTDLNLNSVAKTIVEDDAFEGLFNLKSLTYSPSYMNIGTFRGLSHLGKLAMHLYYRSELINTNLLVDLPSLQELTITVDKNACYSWTKYLFERSNNLKILSFDKYCCSISLPYIASHVHVINLQFINCHEFNPGPELLQSVTDLQVLNLTNNNIESLDFFNNTNLIKLEMLNLGNNELTVINETIFEALPSLKYLDLSGNPFVCNCSNAGFIRWVIQNKEVQVVNAFQYRCSSPLSYKGHFLLNFNVQSCWEYTAFLCFISSSALVLVTLLSSFIYHFLRWQLVYGFYLFQALLYNSKKRRQGCPDIYDAFVSYNVHDEDWVYRELLPELEEQQGWRLCLHHRDFMPGKPIIENITDAIYSSRKTLCVISRHYLQSEWCSREIQMASFRLFDEQKDVLILLFLEEISSNQLSPFYRMRKLVKSRTYLSWTQAQSHRGVFWEKVHRALETGNQPADDNNPLPDNHLKSASFV